MLPLHDKGTKSRVTSSFKALRWFALRYCGGSRCSYRICGCGMTTLLDIDEDSDNATFILMKPSLLLLCSSTTCRFRHGNGNTVSTTTTMDRMIDAVTVAEQLRLEHDCKGCGVIVTLVIDVGWRRTYNYYVSFLRTHFASSRFPKTQSRFE
jgi:hypothetical protein